MQKLFESFRKYSILTEEQLLIEGRKDDAKKMKEAYLRFRARNIKRIDALH